jgi:hypothetical protein
MGGGKSLVSKLQHYFSYVRKNGINKYYGGIIFGKPFAWKYYPPICLMIPVSKKAN